MGGNSGLLKGSLERYVPSVATLWDVDTPGSLWKPVEGTLLFADISGFTNLSEKLSRRGRIGAEELTVVLDRVFSRMLDIVHLRGGSLLKFGGDALLLLFQGDCHAVNGCAAAVEMRATLREASREPTSVGKVDLKMSSGVHSGTIDVFLVGDSHRELIVTGPAASKTTEMEALAGAGEIVISHATAEMIPAGFGGETRDGGRLLRKRKFAPPPPELVPRPPVEHEDLSEFIPMALREVLTNSMTESEHRTANVGFIKFKGVDSLLADRGPRATADELNQLIGDIQAASEAEHVTFLASDLDRDGGKVILVSGVPTSQHDDEGRILRALRAIVDGRRTLGVQAGVNRGHVFAGNVGGSARSTYTVMGDTVNLAARLMAAAPPGMLYVSPTVLDLSSTLFRTEALEPFTVKGKEHPVRAYSVLEETGGRPPDLRYELPFHGREAEVQAIVGIVTTCAQVGRGGMMTLTGDTGVGKSRLIAEVLDRCPGLTTLMLQAEPYGSDNPYWALRDPLRQMMGVTGHSRQDLATSLQARILDIAPDLSWALPLLGDVVHIPMPETPETEAIDPRFRPARTADVVLELFDRIQGAPLAMVVEDGQWIDAACSDLVRRIGEAAESRPWTVIVTIRLDERGLQAFGQEIRLDTLDDDVIRAIALDATSGAPLRPHEIDLIVRRAGGNPLFLTEMLAVVRETGNANEIPDSLDAVVSKQIDTLPPLVRQLLRYTSVLGRSFRSDVMQEYLAPDQLQMDRATTRDLERFIERDGPTRLRFRHAVVHDVAYGGLPYRRRRDLHARAGAVIERMVADDLDGAAELLALHFAESGDHAKAWKYSRVAGDKARRAHATVEAATHYRRAIDAARYLGEVANSDLAEIWTRIGEVHDLVGRYEDARDSYARAARLLADDPIHVAELHLKRAEAWFGSGNISQAKRNISLGRSLVAPGTNGALGLLARLDAYESSIHAGNGDPTRALAAASSAVKRATIAGEEEALARAYGSLDWANFMLGRDQPRLGEAAVEIFERLGQIDRSAMTMNMMGAFAYLEANWDDAVRWYQESVTAAELSGNQFHVANTRANIAEVLVSQRRFAEALPLLDEAERFFRASSSELVRPFVELQQARAMSGLGRVEKALEMLESLFVSQLEAGDGYAWPETALELADSLIRSGRPEEAESRLDRFAATAPESAKRLAAGIARLRGSAALASNRPDAALGLLTAGLANAVADGDLYAELLTLESLIEARDAVGREADPGWSERAAELSRLLGVAPLRTPT